ncbi:MAG: hypothetical protein K2H76_02555 [Muribaculaceae bacterium]|nr:hypothetical protein [Muribaculaceae bacterium]
MDLNPDSILTVLDAVDSTEFRGHDRAVYYLLRTQALDKTNSLTDDSSQIDSALAYFNRHGSDSEKMMANFYKGRYYFFADRYEEAMKHVFLSFQLAQKGEDHYWIAKTAEFVADICSSTFLTDEYLYYEKIAVDNYKIANYYGNYEYALCDYAYEKIYRGELSDGIALCDSIYQAALKSDNHHLAVNAAYCLLDGYTRAKETGKGLKIFSYLESRPENIPTSYNYSLAGELYRMRNQLDSAAHYLNVAKQYLKTDREKVTLFSEYKQLYLLTGDTVNAYKMSDSLFDQQNAYMKILLEQPPTRAQKNYFSDEASRQSKVVLSRNVVILFVSVVFVTILIILIIYGKQREKNKNLEIEVKLNEICQLNDSVRNLENNIKGLHTNISNLSDDIKKIDKDKKVDAELFQEHCKELEQIFYSQFHIVGRLAKEYFEKGAVKSARNEIIKQIEKEIKKWESPEKIAEIERSLNLYSNNVVKRLREQCPNLNSSDISFLIFLWIGLPPKAVALFCSLKIGYFYTKRQRIIKKIMDSSAPDKEEFIRRTAI